LLRGWLWLELLWGGEVVEIVKIIGFWLGRYVPSQVASERGREFNKNSEQFRTVKGRLPVECIARFDRL
jgi:hypothetical protein